MPLGVGALLGVSAGTQILGGILGRKDAKGTERAQRKQIGLAAGEIRGGLDAARGYLDQQLDVARGIEDSVLGSLDSAYAMQVRNILDQERAARADLEQDLQGSGLNTTSIASSMRGQQRGQTSRAMTDLGARFAVERGDQIMRARQPVMAALGGRADLEFQGGQQLGQLYGGVQIQGPNTGAAIGAIGGGLTSAYLQGQQLDILRDALKTPLSATT